MLKPKLSILITYFDVY